MLSLVIIIVLLVVGFLFGYYIHYAFLPLQVSGVLFGSIANWCGVFGTIAAVITSLWLALRKKKPNVLFSILYDESWKIGCENYDFSPILLEIKYYDEDNKQRFVSLNSLGISHIRTHPVPVLALLNLHKSKINKKLFVSDRISGWKGVLRIKSKKNSTVLMHYKINIGFIHWYPKVIYKYNALD